MVESTQQQLNVYLVHFRKHMQHIDFCLQELEALANLNGVTVDKLYAQDPSNIDVKVNPTVYVNLPSVEICKSIVSRSILIKEIIDVFAESSLEPVAKPRQLEDVSQQEESKGELEVGQKRLHQQSSSGEEKE